MAAAPTVPLDFPRRRRGARRCGHRNPEARTGWHCQLRDVTHHRRPDRVLFTELLLPFEVTSVLITRSPFSAPVALARHATETPTKTPERTAAQVSSFFSQDVLVLVSAAERAACFALGVLASHQAQFITLHVHELMLNALNLSFGDLRAPVSTL